ncbi:penicillin-binding protein dimerization domain protein [Streptococcus ictaluri 707-05]|uniref:Penicillin-binding protein dimerization domain protein n=1 Tax=Streptococcus ictaluri 707-05 TaxID=764299 RepID=G5K5V8_9STRE|nr:penicillin-binding protein dimerization domain protein [Streptococcus ictaluri 707-05]
MGSFIKKQKASIPRRLHLLFFIIVFLVTSLILRLAYMQIYDHQFYLSKLNATTLYHVRESKPRGSIFDREGKALVTNNDKEVVTFTRSPKASVADIKVLANRLAQFMELPQLPVSTRSKKDYYLADPKVYAKVVDRSADKEKTDRFGNRLTQATIYQNALASVKEKDLVYSQDQLKVIAVFNQMNATASFNTVKLKTEPLTDYIKAYIQANQSQLKGIWIGSDWEREVRDTSLTSIIGKISSREAGLPKEEADAYLKKGYALNDRVGTSYLEKQYEDLLQGKPVIKQIKINKSGKK